MLVLSRRVSETIVIGDDIRVTVVALGNGKVRLGFEAPPGIEIWRSELVPAVRREPAASTQEVVK